MIEEHDIETLLRRLTGEMSVEERRGIEARLAAEPELQVAAARLERDWNGLDLPTAGAPPGFAADVMARISAAEPELPAWARLAAAAALVAGVALGVGLGRVAPDDGLAEVLTGVSTPTLAERYVAALEKLDREPEAEVVE